VVATSSRPRVIHTFSSSAGAVGNHSTRSSEMNPMTQMLAQQRISDRTQVTTVTA